MLSNDNSLPKHGGNIQGFAKAADCLPGEVVDFSSNINPLGLSGNLRGVYQASVSDLIHYPDPLARTMCRAAATYHDVNPHNVIAGNGSMALIDLVIRSLKPKKALLLEPCFNEYRRLLRLAGSDIDHMVLKPENNFEFPLEGILKKLPNVDVLIVGCPNNPTGSTLSPDQCVRLMEEARRTQTSVLIDEAFMDWFEYNSMIRLAMKFPSVIVVRSLTKFYALPGIRAGYACAGKHMIERMRSLQETWSCNGIAQNLAVAALTDSAFQSKSRQWFNEESHFLFESLQKIPSIRVFPSQANFFLCRMTDASRQNQFWQDMMRARIYLREVSDLISLDHSYFRLALKTRKENCVLLQKIQESLQDTENNDDRNILRVSSGFTGR